MQTPNLEVIAEILHAGRMDAFVGLLEGQQFDAKEAAAYDLTTASGRYELSKDASSFANASGGYLVIGLTHAKSENLATETVSGLDLVPRESFNPGRYSGIIAEYVHPRIAGLDVAWTPSQTDPRSGVGVILVPPQRDDDKPFVIARVVEDGAALKHIVFGLARRKGADSVPLTAVEIQGALRKGMDTISQRLSRIEAKLDAVVRSSEPTLELTRDEQLRKRILSLIQEST